MIPLYTPECRECKSCTSRKTNLCTAIRATQGKGVMPDGTSRFSIGRQAGPSLHGLLDVLELHGAAGNRGREDPRRRAVREGLLHRLRRDHRHRRGHQHREGRAGRERRRVRARRHRPQRDPGRAHGGRQQDRRRRHQPAAQVAGRAVRHDPLREPEGGQGGPRRLPGRADRRRRGLQLRVRGQRRPHAAGAGVLPPRLGRVGHHRRRRVRARRSRRGRSSSSPAASGRARRSAAPAAAPTCRRSWTGTWTARSTSTT